MLPTMTAVQSSHIAAVGYDGGELHIQYHNGKTSIYGDDNNPVSEDVASMVMGASSVGQAVHQIVKGQYAHRYAY